MICFVLLVFELCFPDTKAIVTRREGCLNIYLDVLFLFPSTFSRSNSVFMLKDFIKAYSIWPYKSIGSFLCDFIR
jgi:hypothetical protein